jgi:hypothetical protein
MKTMEETDPITSIDLLALGEDLAHAKWELKRQKIEAVEYFNASEKEIAELKTRLGNDARKITRLVERSESIGPALTESREEVSRVRFELKRLKIIALSQTAIVIAYFALKFSGILF